MVLVLVRAQRVLLPVNGHLNPSCEWIPELSSRERLPLIKSQREIFSQKSQRHQEHREHYLAIKHDTKVEAGKDPCCTSSWGYSSALPCIHSHQYFSRAGGI